MAAEIAGRHHELLDGELVEMAPPGGGHGLVENNIGHELRLAIGPTGAAAVFSGEPGVVLRRNSDRVRAPDVCVFLRGRLPEDRPPEGYFEVIPDLVVEV